VSDRFGDYGLVGAVIFEAGAEAVEVDTLLLSCRALGRGVEHRMLARLGEVARARALGGVNVPFVPTGKNQPALDFLSQSGGLRGPREGGWEFSFTADHAASLAAQAGGEHFTAGETAPNNMAIATPEE
jgi:predicted enzyme involved in methoxymalonyl-ACP biosynthesis